MKTNPSAMKEVYQKEE